MLSNDTQVFYFSNSSLGDVLLEETKGIFYWREHSITIFMVSALALRVISLKNKFQPKKYFSRTCAEHRCLHGARCVDARGELPSCACEMECDSIKYGFPYQFIQFNISILGIASNMSVCGSDGQTYEGLCQLRLFACKHQIDLMPVSLGICDSGTIIRMYYILYKI